MSRTDAHQIAEQTSKRFPRIPVHTTYNADAREFGWILDSERALVEARGSVLTQTYCAGVPMH